MKPFVPHRTDQQRGFALVVTLSLMILLTVIAVGLLSLSSISLRSANVQSANNIARANARLGLMMALGELQKAAGDDRRITVDGSIFDGAKNPNVVGVWKSWSPKLAANPLQAAPNYAAAKDSGFVGWLTSSGNPSDLASKDWGKTGTISKPVELFTQTFDGFSLSGSKVEVQNGQPSAGAMAWTVVQSATRAKINVGGPEDDQRVLNDDLQVQARPSLVKSGRFKQPVAGWNQRADRVISMAQARLDSDLWQGGASPPEGADFTSQGFGLLTDPVNGGLKTDLSLGFEMSDTDFKQATWGGIKNPFRGTSVTQYTTPTSYKGQRLLFRPLISAGSVTTDVKFDPANARIEFPAAAVPTFDTLRSFYLTPYHLYNTADGPTVFERGMEHVALNAPQPFSLCPGLTPGRSLTQTSYRPVLDRVIYVFSLGLGADQEVRLIITPLITLWNPYNVALEIEGAVAYPWMDFPFQAKWKIGSNPEQSVALSQIMGVQFSAAQHGRSVNPYFFASITADGSGTAAAGKSIRFQPGEVRVFAPTNPTPVDYVANGSIRQRMLPLIPVTTPAQYSIKGGFAIPMKNPVTGNQIANRKVASTDSVSLTIVPSERDGRGYPFAVGLEDATRAQSSSPVDGIRGKLVSDVQTVNFSKSGSVTTLVSPVTPYAQLISPALRKPFGIIETYHRVAKDASANRRSDLVFTTNPRQPFINRYLTNGNFEAGPHYETGMRSPFTLSEVMQTFNGGRNAFYGESNGTGGKTHLSFFEVPQSLPLSLASFQHADLAGTSYSTAYQAGNSWASAYLARNSAAVLLPAVQGAGGDKGEASYDRGQLPVYDYSYLVNETLWDSFYFSGASPRVLPGTATGKPDVWDSNVVNVTGSSKSMLTEFIDDPVTHPLRNPRMRFHAGSSPPAELKTELVKPEGCIKLATHLHVDGAFNINSTSEKAWVAFLSGMRDRPFDVSSGSLPSAGRTAFPRFRNPIGTDSDNWMGYRSLSDSEVGELARQIVIQIKKRGPFLSLAEFINRRVESGDLGLKGTIQAAIDDSKFNKSVSDSCDPFDPNAYPSSGKNNIAPANTGVGIPGYLTQADVLQSIAPVMSARSDTFTIRGYGEAKDSSGKVLAAVCCEAVVQRMPEFVDGANPPHATVAELNPTNQAFGRRFSMVSFRYLNSNELVL